MAARKKKSARKAVKKKVRRAAARPKARIRKRHQPETFRIRTITVGYTVNDIERSVAWYRDVFGMVLGDRWTENGKLLGAEMKAGTASIWLGQDDWAKGRDRKKGEGVRIFCKTAQDVDALADDIKSRGGVLDHDPQDQSWGQRDFGLTDPDGYRITVSTL